MASDPSFPADALLFDLGGVVMSLDWDRAFSRWAGDSGESAEALRGRFRLDIHYERHERGEIGERDYYASLREALGYLDKDREFLKAGGVFDDDFIDMYIELKMQEVIRFEHTPHPVEYEMYYSA